MKTVVVWYNGMGITIAVEVADYLNLKGNQEIMTKAEVWNVIHKNAEFMINYCKIKLAEQGLQND